MGKLPADVLYNITSYFKWKVHTLLPQPPDVLGEYTRDVIDWPVLLYDCYLDRTFDRITVKNFFLRPIPFQPFNVPRFTLVTYQPNHVLNNYDFEENNSHTDDYLMFRYEAQDHPMIESDKESNPEPMEVRVPYGNPYDPIILSSDDESTDSD